MNETRALIEAFDTAMQRNERCALATLVSVDGSSYRRPGARMLICESGAASGMISAGCLENDVIEQALRVITTAETTLLEYDTASTTEEESWGFGLGCNGIVRILVEPLGADSHYMGALRRSITLPEGRSVHVATVYAAADGMPLASRLFIDEAEQVSHDLYDLQLASSLENDLRIASKSESRSYGAVRVFMEKLQSPVRLLILGAGPDALPVVELARQVGWQTEVVDAQARPASLDRFAAADKVTLARPEEVETSVDVTRNTMTLVMTHNYIHDLTLLRFLVNSPARYIGVVGARKRAERLMAEIQPNEHARARLHAPAGIDIGASGPVEIALAVVAEMRAVLDGRSGGMLREQMPRTDAIEEGDTARGSVHRIAHACAGGSWASAL